MPLAPSWMNTDINSVLDEYYTILTQRGGQNKKSTASEGVKTRVKSHGLMVYSYSLNIYAVNHGTVFLRLRLNFFPTSQKSRSSTLPSENGSLLSSFLYLLSLSGVRLMYPSIGTLASIKFVEIYNILHSQSYADKQITDF